MGHVGVPRHQSFQLLGVFRQLRLRRDRVRLELQDKGFVVAAPPNEAGHFFQPDLFGSGEAVEALDDLEAIFNGPYEKRLENAMIPDAVSQFQVINGFPINVSQSDFRFSQDVDRQMLLSRPCETLSRPVSKVGPIKEKWSVPVLSLENLQFAGSVVTPRQSGMPANRFHLRPFVRDWPNLTCRTDKTFQEHSMPKVTEAIHNFVLARRATHNGPDLLDRILARPGAMEIQINVAADNGEPVDGKRSTYTDGEYEWFNIRIPKNAATTPEFRDYELRWPLDLHVEGHRMDGLGLAGPQEPGSRFRLRRHHRPCQRASA